MALPPQICENDTAGMSEDREIDYVICRECHTPCYIFEMEGEELKEALCQVCGNEDPSRFSLGEVEEA
jgi:hypothetical protein